MEKFKIINFMQDYKDACFPEFSELSPQKCEEIRSLISLRFDIKTEDSCEFVYLINTRQLCIDTLNAEDSSFDLQRIFEQLKIKPQEMIFINWYRYDRIDTMSFVDLANFFDYIWFPSSDDVDIFDASFDWILSIDHAGFVKLLN